MRISAARWVAHATLLIACTATAAPAWAQQTRAEELAQQQAAKSKQLRPNTPNKGERFFEWLEDYTTSPNQLYVTFGGVYRTGGFAPGVGWRHAFGRARFNMGGAWSMRNYKMAQTTLTLKDLAGDKLDLDFNARFLDGTQLPFYGIGNETVRADRASFGLRTTEGAALATIKPVRWFRVGGGVGGERHKDRRGVGARHPSIEQAYSALTAPGLFSETTYTRTTAFTAIDWRESPGYTRRGGLYSVAFHNYKESDDIFTFRRVDIDLREFVPLLKEQWVLAFRAFAQMTDNDAGHVIPYYMLPSLGGHLAHRAYSDFRFRDKNLLLLSAEYRWLPSRILDLALFVDSGKVASCRCDLDFDGLKTGYGIGMRFHGYTFTPIRVDVAHGDEGFRFHFTGGVAF